jgi:hypothetical protein
VTDVSPAITRLGNPAQSWATSVSKTWTYAKNVWVLFVYGGKVYGGMGNSSNVTTLDADDTNGVGSTGGVPTLVYDPATGLFTYEGDHTSPTKFADAQVDRFLILDGDLIRPGHDPFGKGLNFSRKNTGAWTTILQIDYSAGPPEVSGNHTFDMAAFGGRWFMGGQGSAATTMVMSSSANTSTHPENTNSNWTGCTTVNTAFQFHALFVVGGRLYAIQQNVPDFSVNTPVWECSSGTTFSNLSTTASALYPGMSLTPSSGGMGTPAAIAHPSGSLTNLKPWDIWTDGSTLRILWSYTSGSDTVVSLTESSDLSTWTELFSFKPNAVGAGSQGQTFARSYEYLDGVHYFGLGSVLTASAASQPANVGDWLVYDQAGLDVAPIAAASSVAASLTVRKPLAASVHGSSAVGLGLTAGGLVAGSFSDYTENKILDWKFGGVAYTPPATYYAAAFTVAPTDAGGGTEVSTSVWTNYARVAVTKNQTNFPASSGGSVANGVAIDFGTAAVTGTPPVVVAVALFDASSAGNMTDWADLTTSKTINNGDPVSIAIGALVITLT